MSDALDALEIESSAHKNLQLLQPQSLAQHPAAVYLSQLRPKSQQTMRRNLNMIASLLTQGQCDLYTLDWRQLRYHHTAAVRAVLVEKFAPSTVNQMLCALRRVLKEAKKLKLMSPSDYTDAVDVENVRFTKELRGRALKPAEIAAIMQVINTDLTAAGRRDSALFIILLGSGVRRQEVVSLDLSDFDPNSGAIKVRGGKGGKDRTVYLPSNGIKAVSTWLKVRGVKAGPLLYPVSKSHRVMGRRLTDQSVLYILQKRAKQAGVDSFSPHDCRRTFISSLLAAGADLVTVSQLAGHANPMTTSKYDRRGEAAKRQAIELLHIPYDE